MYVKAIKEGTITNTASVSSSNNLNPTTDASYTTVIKAQNVYSTEELRTRCSSNVLKVSADNKRNIEYELKFTVVNSLDLTDRREYTLLLYLRI